MGANHRPKGGGVQSTLEACAQPLAVEFLLLLFFAQTKEKKYRNAKLRELKSSRSLARKGKYGGNVHCPRAYLNKSEWLPSLSKYTIISPSSDCSLQIRSKSDSMCSSKQSE